MQNDFVNAALGVFTIPGSRLPRLASSINCGIRVKAPYAKRLAYFVAASLSGCIEFCKKGRRLRRQQNSACRAPGSWSGKSEI